MQAWAHRLARLGEVRPFDYRYRLEGRRAPDRMPKLLARHQEALEEARADHDGPVVLIGKSMGSRVGTVLSAEIAVDAVVALGYPLKAIRADSPLRDGPLLAVGAPMLFVQGTRDRMCPLDALETVRARMTAPNALHVVDDGDHSLKLRKTYTKQTGITQEQADDAALVAIGEFLSGVLAGG